MKLKRLLAVLLCICLVSSCVTVLAAGADGKMTLDFSRVQDEVIINGEKIYAEVAGIVGIDNKPEVKYKGEMIKTAKKLLQALGDSETLDSFLGDAGNKHYQPGMNPTVDDYLISLKGSLALNNGVNSIVVVNMPADIRVAGDFAAVILGPEAEDSLVTIKGGNIGTMLVAASGVTVSNGGNIRNLIPSDDTVLNTLHRHYPGEQRVVNEVPATYTEGGHYTLITYCGDPTCGQQIDIVTYQTDPLPLPANSVEAAPAAEPEPAAPAAEPVVEQEDECPKGGEHDFSLFNAIDYVSSNVYMISFQCIKCSQTYTRQATDAEIENYLHMFDP